MSFDKEFECLLTEHVKCQKEKGRADVAKQSSVEEAGERSHEAGAEQ